MRTIIRRYECVNKDQVRESLAILEKEKHIRKTNDLIDTFKTLMIERKLTPEQAEAMLNEINARVLYEML